VVLLRVVEVLAHLLDDFADMSGIAVPEVDLGLATGKSRRRQQSKQRNGTRGAEPSRFHATPHRFSTCLDTCWTRAGTARSRGFNHRGRMMLRESSVEFSMTLAGRLSEGCG